MEYKFFDKRFLVMPYDKNVIGKKVFYRDTLTGIINEVENGDVHSDRYGVLDDICIGSAHPFYIDDVYWGLVYYDPNYEAKVAYSQGKQIQYKAADAKWEDVTEKPLWCERNVYRVKPEPVFEVIKQDGVYKKVSCSLVPNFFSGTAEECDAWIVEHTPKTRRMTNKELMRWLAEGKGERVDIATEYISLYYSYEKSMDNEECDKDIRIRAWDETEWHEPLVEVAE